MKSDIALIDAARRALVEARTVPELSHLRDQAKAMEHYLKRRDGADAAARNALDIRLRAERRIGEMLETTVSRGGSKSRAATLPESVTRSDSSRWQRVASLSDEVFEAELAKPEPSTARLVKVANQRSIGATARNSAGPTCTVEDLKSLAESGRRFGTIYADPPWQYGNQSTRAATNNHYVTMPFDEIAALPVGDLAAENSHLHLWCTTSFLAEGIELLSAWGFEYKSFFVWVKPEMGIGNYWRVSHEYMLLGVRGKCPFLNHAEKSWMQASRSAGHSAKPEGVRAKIEKVSPGPYLELFGRLAAPGWTVWGNEVSRCLFTQDAEEICT